MDRHLWAESLFKKEVTAYSILKPYQGDVIPKCYGAYTISIPDRELEQDRQVQVLLVARIQGSRLSQTPSWKVTDKQKSAIRARVPEIFEIVNRRGIFLPAVSADDILFERQTGRVLLIEFTRMIEEMEFYKETQNDSVEEFMMRLGYV
jgi:hypothetical protein